jgi:hypothetical protein
LAHILSEHVDVTLTLPHGTDLTSEKVKLEAFSRRYESRLSGLVAGADVVLGSIELLQAVSRDTLVEKPLIIDLEASREDPSRDPRGVRSTPRDMQGLLMRGDFFICSSEGKRDFWLGALLATDRINPLTYERDETLRRLIDVVPEGLTQRTETTLSMSLLSFCTHPHRAIDNAIRMHASKAEGPPTPLHELPEKALAIWREQGLGTLIARIVRHTWWRLHHKHPS